MYWSALLCGEICITHYICSPEMSSWLLPRTRATEAKFKCTSGQLNSLGNNQQLRLQEVILFWILQAMGSIPLWKGLLRWRGILRGTVAQGEMEKRGWGQGQQQEQLFAWTYLFHSMAFQWLPLLLVTFVPMWETTCFILPVFSSSCCKFLFFISLQMWK